MTPYRLGYWLKTIVADIVPVQGLLFVNYLDLSNEALVSKVSAHPSPKDAQKWMNIVLLDDFISEVVRPRFRRHLIVSIEDRRIYDQQTFHRRVQG